MFEEFSASMNFFGQPLKAKDNRGEVALGNPIVAMGATRLRDFLRRNPPEFYGSKVFEDLIGLLMRCLSFFQSWDCLAFNRRIWLRIN